MKILNKTYISDFPFQWANLDYLPDSKAIRKEIYLKDQIDLVEGLIFLFYSLFKDLKQKLIIFDRAWWDFCLDTWNAKYDTYDYTIETKSEETKAYLNMLKESEIEISYSGSCYCENWEKYLPIILKCIINHQAPYSPIFCDLENNFFFYFHHTGSIGLYYRTENSVVQNIIEIAAKEFQVQN